MNLKEKQQKERLDFIRKNRWMTNKALAKALGCHERTIYRILANEKAKSQK